MIRHGHTHDSIVLKTLLQRNDQPKYIGMIGSKIKVRQTLGKMMESQIPEERIARVFTPVGLNIGGESPAEIALSILAEIQALRYDKKAIHMKDLE
ncbi:MAG: XdhC family protein [Oligoflexia bacterium]|nr:XdhC family protein [Oligoflexia bacterium]